MSLISFLNPDAILDGSIGGIKLTDGSITSSKVDSTIATKKYVDDTFKSSVATQDAMVYKGTLGTGGTITTLPSTTAKIGWTYKVITTGTYAGQVCEIGDMIVCLTGGSESTPATWTVIQANIDGALIGPASSKDNQVAVFSGTTGKAIKAVDATSLIVGSALESHTADQLNNSLSLEVGATTKTFNGSSAVSAKLSSNSITIPVPKVYEITTSTNTISILASTHGCGTKPIVQCYESGEVVICNISINSAGDVTVEFNGTHNVTVRVLGIGTQTLSDFIKLE